MGRTRWFCCTVVLAAALACWIVHLRPLGAAFTLLFYDQRGGGRSTVLTDSAALTVDRHVADLEAIRQHFGLERLNLIGLSWGATLAGSYATAHPARVQRLALVAPADPTSELWAESGRALESRFTPVDVARMDSAVRMWAADPRAACRLFYSTAYPRILADPQANPEWLLTDCDKAPIDGIRAFWTVNGLITASLGKYDLRPGLRQVTAPTLVVIGASDFILQASARAWVSGRPQTRLLVLPDAGHVLFFDQPEAMFAALRAFFAGGWPPLATVVP